MLRNCTILGLFSIFLTLFWDFFGQILKIIKGWGGNKVRRVWEKNKRPRTFIRVQRVGVLAVYYDKPFPKYFFLKMCVFRFLDPPGFQ